MTTLGQPTECPAHRAAVTPGNAGGISFGCGCWTASTAAGVRIFWAADREHSFTRAEVLAERAARKPTTLEASAAYYANYSY